MPAQPDPDTAARDDLVARSNRLLGELADDLERVAVEQNHGLIYMLIGWQHLAACLATNYLIEVLQLQPPHRYPYLIPWIAWIAAALLTVRLARTPGSGGERSPLVTATYRLWLVFFLLCGNVVCLNLLTRSPLFLFLPVLATLSTFAFSVMTNLVSRRFLPACLIMFATSPLIAVFPTYGFALYGTAWLVILQVLGFDLFRKRRRWLAEAAYHGAVLPFPGPTRRQISR